VSCIRYDLKFKYVQGKIRLYRTDEETGEMSEVEWETGNEDK
jgi:hypothetical protein